MREDIDATVLPDERDNYNTPSMPLSTAMVSTSKNEKILLPTTKEYDETRQNHNAVVATWSTWRAALDGKRGRIYYYDTAPPSSATTRRSTWDRPAGFPEFKLSASRRVAMEERRRVYSEWQYGEEGSEEGTESPSNGGGEEEAEEEGRTTTGRMIAGIDEGAALVREATTGPNEDIHRQPPPTRTALGPSPPLSLPPMTMMMGCMSGMTYRRSAQAGTSTRAARRAAEQNSIGINNNSKKLCCAVLLC